MQSTTSGNINYVSPTSSSTTPLAANAVFVGTGPIGPGIEMTLYKSVTVNCFTDADSAPGGLSLQFSSDQVNWDFKFNFDVKAGIPFYRVMQSVAEWFRIVYTNGSGAQTIFRLQTILQSQTQPNFVPVITYEPSVVGFPTTAYGDNSSVERVAAVVQGFGYRFQQYMSKVTNTGSGTSVIAANTNYALMSSGTTANSSSVISSIPFARHLAGSGLRFYASAVFETPNAQGSQFVGMGNELDGFFFGYLGTVFGILYKRNNVSTFFPQSTWGYSTLTSGNQSVFILNPAKCNTYTIHYQTDTGTVKFYVQSPNGIVTLVHIIEYPNSTDIPIVSRAGFRCYAQVTNGSATQNVKARVFSMSIYIEGIPRVTTNLIRHCASVWTSKVVSIKDQVVLAIRNKSQYLSQVNWIPIRLDMMCGSADKKYVGRFKKYVGRFFLVRDVTCVEGALTYADVNGDDSVVEFARPDPPMEVATGTRVMAFSIEQKGNISIDLEKYNIELYPGQSIAVVYRIENVGFTRDLIDEVDDDDLPPPMDAATRERLRGGSLSREKDYSAAYTYNDITATLNWTEFFV